MEWDEEGCIERRLNGMKFLPRIAPKTCHWRGFPSKGCACINNAARHRSWAGNLKSQMQLGGFPLQAQMGVSGHAWDIR